jgi:hypothetical protein
MMTHMRGWTKLAVIIGSAGLIVAMIAVWLLADLNTAAQVASVIAGAAGIVVLVYTMLLGVPAPLPERLGAPDPQAERPAAPGPQPERRVADTGRSSAENDGRANAGIASRGPGVAERTGDATSHGGTANSGIMDDL